MKRGIAISLLLLIGGASGVAQEAQKADTAKKADFSSGLFVSRMRDEAGQYRTRSPEFIGSGVLLVLRDKREEAKSFRPNMRAINLAKANLLESSFNVTYSGSPPAEARTAFEHALGIWSLYVDSDVPIEVEMNWTPLGENVLGAAGPTQVRANFPNAPQRSVFYPIALANKFAGADLAPSDSDIQCQMNSTWSAWYFGTNGMTPAGQTDFVSVCLHEIGHGLGFVGSARINAAGQGEWGFAGLPLVFDEFVHTGNGTHITDTSRLPNPSNTLAQAFTSDDLWFVDQHLGYNYKLFAPSPFDDGSSFSHLDEVRFSEGDLNSLMTPQLARSESIHEPGPVTENIFRNLGWTTRDIPIFRCVTPLGDLTLSGRDGSIDEIVLDGLWTAQLSGSTLAISTATGEHTYNSNETRRFFSHTEDGYVSFSIGSGVVSELEFGNLDTDEAFYVEYLRLGVPFIAELQSAGEPISATDRLEAVQLGTDMSALGNVAPERRTATPRLAVRVIRPSHPEGSVKFTDPSGDLVVLCEKRKIRENYYGGRVTVHYRGKLFMNIWGDPHIALPEQGNAQFQQADKDLLVVLPDERTAMIASTLDVFNKSQRVINNFVIFDTKGDHLIHEVAGLNTILPVNYDVHDDSGTPLSSKRFYRSKLLSLPGDRTLLSQNGRLMGWRSSDDSVLDYEILLERRCQSFQFAAHMISAIGRDVNKLKAYYIERRGSRNGVKEAWMDYHVDLFRE